MDVKITYIMYTVQNLETRLTLYEHTVHDNSFMEVHIMEDVWFKVEQVYLHRLYIKLVIYKNILI